MKSESWLIIQLGGALLVLGLMSFFVVPLYEKGAWFVMGAIYGAFNAVIGYKFGRSMPEQKGDPKPGQESKTEIITTSALAPAPPDMPAAPPSPPKEPSA